MTEDLVYQARTYNKTEVYKLLLDDGRMGEHLCCPDMAHIALSTMLDAVGDGVSLSTTLTSLYQLTGERIEDQARISFAKAVQPRFHEFILERYLNDSTKSYNQKMRNVRLEYELKAMEDPTLLWDEWSKEEQIEIGAWACWIIQQVTNWFTEAKAKTDSQEYPTTRFLTLSDEGLSARDAILAFAAENAYCRLPMVTKPKRWTRDSKEGGYLTQGPGDTKQLIHGSMISTDPSDLALDFLNNVHEQAFRVNTWVLDIMRVLSEENCEIGAFASYVKKAYARTEFSDDVWDLPDDSEEKMQARAIVAKERSKEVKLKQKAISPAQVVALAQLFRDVPRIYSPWFFDTRLRAYPLVTKLSPQGADYQKALLLFADCEAVTDDNREEVKEVLLIAIGTTWGNKIDKKSFKDRRKWAEDHVNDHLVQIVEHPHSIESKEIWQKADEPFQHLALLKEFYDIFVAKTSSACSVPIGYDATCSGLQLLGSFVRDEETCRLVNVTPSERPQDAYAAVAKVAHDILADPERWRKLNGRADDESHGIPIDKIDRKVAKKVVMLIPYGGTYNTLAGHVEDETKEWGISLRDVHTLTKALIVGMDTAVPGFSALNKWFKKAASTAMKQHESCIKWETAAGSTAYQYYQKSRKRDILTHALGVSKYNETMVLEDGTKREVPLGAHSRSQWTSLVEDTDKVDPRKHVTAIAANWTHSQDASVLQLALHDYDRPFTTVHDCVYAPATSIRGVVARIRRAFVDVVEWGGLANFLDSNEIDLPLPPIGTADVTAALKSEYLFS